MRNPRTLLVLSALSVLALPPSAQATTAGPGWALYTNSYPTHLTHGVNEVQGVTTGPEATTFTLSFAGAETQPLPIGATAATVQSAVEGLATVGVGNASVADGQVPGAYKVTFQGRLGDMEVPELEGSAVSVSVETLGATSGTIVIDIFNVGAAGSEGAVTVTDTLPVGVRAKSAGQLRDLLGGGGIGVHPLIRTDQAWTCTGNGTGSYPNVAGATIVTCNMDQTQLSSFPGGGGTPTWGPLQSLAQPQPAIGISVEADTEEASVTNRAVIAGGGAPGPASSEDPITVSSTPAEGGIDKADAWFSNADGTIDTQAGSHPYTATFAFDLATANNAKGEPSLPGGEVRTFETTVPSGLVGDLHTTQKCTHAQLGERACPPASMVGRFTSSALPIIKVTKQVFNMTPQPGEPAELGFEYAGTRVFVGFKVQTGGNYAIDARVDNVPQKEIYQSILTLWGVPQDPSHNHFRGNAESGCTQEQMEESPKTELTYCTAPQGPVIAPFLTLPTSCGGPQSFAFRELSGWQDPTARSEATTTTHNADGTPSGFTGCDAIGFEATIGAATETARADSATGLSVDVRPNLGGLEDAQGVASADLRDTTVTLPEGLVINPGQASGLTACGPTEDALTTEAERTRGEENTAAPTCSHASKVGTVTIKSPLIEGDPEKQFEGNVYVLPSNPPEVKLLVAASADGVNLKLVGTASLCQAQGEVLDGKTCGSPGQVIASFKGTPQLPFSDFKLTFEGGPKAALDTPTQCGTYTAEADFTPWSSPFAPDSLRTFALGVSEGADGSPCPSGSLPFAPTMTAGSTSTQAGAFTGFSLVLARADGQQRIEKLQLTEPAGLAGLISQVPLCPEPQAAQGACDPASHIGHAIVTSGPGNNPLVIPQPGEPEAPIYLTGPYQGAPFGLSIATPIIAGPFNLGTIITRAKIDVDPNTAQITITTDPLPQIVKGVPTDIRSISSVIDRPNFLFNPTNCNDQSFTGTAVSAGGAATAPLSSRFGIGSCRELSFRPKFSVSTSGKASKAGGASLDVKVAAHGGPQPAGGGEANIRSVKVSLPKQLPSRLTTLQKACLAAVFEANPASCPKESDVGTATAKTPILANPLTGPAYLVSHGGAAFPDLEIVLQGEGIKLVLDGHTDIKKGITTSTFNTVPDAPISSFELKLPTGAFSVLTGYVAGSNHYSFCGQSLTLPTTITAQNGAVITQTTKLGVTGCPKAKTRAQKLTAAMKVCRKKAKRKRAGCEKQARRKYGRLKKKK